MTVFEVCGPKEIPFTLTNNVKHINKDNKNEFLKALVEERIDKKQGCYIFCLKAGPGYRAKLPKEFTRNVCRMGRLQSITKFSMMEKKAHQ